MSPINFMQPYSVYGSPMYPSTPYAGNYVIPQQIGQSEHKSSFVGKYWPLLLAATGGAMALIAHKMPASEKVVKNRGLISRIFNRTTKSVGKFFERTEPVAKAETESKPGIISRAYNKFKGVFSSKKEAYEVVSEKLTKSEKKQISKFLKKNKNLSTAELKAKQAAEIATGKYAADSEERIMLDKKYRIAIRKATRTEKAVQEAQALAAKAKAPKPQPLANVQQDVILLPEKPIASQAVEIPQAKVEPVVSEVKAEPIVESTPAPKAEPVIETAQAPTPVTKPEPAAESTPTPVAQAEPVVEAAPTVAPKATAEEISAAREAFIQSALDEENGFTREILGQMFDQKAANL